ncbi:YifB family Mg chelatase-like AAA ATPase [Corynebacterium epidermidicanis]|nr:YifB family Mg chelatase-like AAA ATPase [Corynebacterium epidermidicanis]
MKGLWPVLAKTYSAALVGVDATLVEVEAHIGAGLPGVYIVGLADASISESRDRMKTAMLNSQLPWPKTKVVVNLSPAGLRKSGSHFDLSIICAILIGSLREDMVRAHLQDTMFLGEVGLDGSIKPVRGVLPALRAAKAFGVTQCIIPNQNAAEAALLDGLDVMTAGHVLDIVSWARGENPLPNAGHQLPNATTPMLDMADVAGQDEARYAAEIAAAGGHHMMMVGPPGSGKSMIAARIPGLLPPLQAEECVAVTSIHSVVGTSFTSPVVSAPFVAPHHSVSRAGLLGGGSGHPLPGAVSLAHHGVLFLDEVSEIPAAVLDSLRLPLENGLVRMVRRQQEITFPAQFQLVMAANTCRCGADTPSKCTCSAALRQRFLGNVSGPLRDRVDLFVRTHAHGAVLGVGSSESSPQIAERVAVARERAAQRWARAGLEGTNNARMNPHRLRREFPADEAAMAYLAALLADGALSQRGVDRSLKVAWTIADLQGSQIPTLDHVAQAIDLHATSEQLGVAV